jgi:hypothetical protein
VRIKITVDQNVKNFAGKIIKSVATKREICQTLFQYSRLSVFIYGHKLTSRSHYILQQKAIKLQMKEANKGPIFLLHSFLGELLDFVDDNCILLTSFQKINAPTFLQK